MKFDAANKLVESLSLMKLTSVLSRSFLLLPYCAALLSAGLQAQDEDDTWMEEVVVTSDRRMQDYQDYAGTAISFSGEDLKMQGIQDITDLSESVVGLEIGNQRGNVEVWIRGVGSADSTERGDPAAATHFDGIYIPRPRGIGGAFFDIERVEVNVGPQGTLRGRNAMAGSVNAIFWKPGLERWDVSLETEFGNYDQQVYQAIFNIPVGDKFATRLSLLKKDHDAYYNDVSPVGRTGAESADDTAMRLQFLYQPTDQLRILLAGDYLTEEGTGYTGTNYANPLGNGISADDIDDPRDVWARGITPIQDTTHWGIKFQVDYEFDSGSVLEFNYGYRDLRYDYQASTPLSPDYPGIIDNLGGPNVRETLDDFSRFQDVTDSQSEIYELRYYTPADNEVFYTAGIFYFKEDQYTFLGSTGDGVTYGQGFEFNQPDTDTESLAFYGDATWNVTDRTRLTAGVRFTDESKSRNGVNASYRYGGVGDNTENPAAAGDGMGFRFGTEGFEFAIEDRSIFDFSPARVDYDGDGTIEASETQVSFALAYIDFIEDGVKTWGRRDNFDEVLATRRQQLEKVIEGMGIHGVDPGQVAGEPDLSLAEIIAQWPGAFQGEVNAIVPECIDTRLDDEFACPASGNFYAIFEFSPLLSIVPQQASVEYSFTDWRFRAEHDITDDSLVYFSVATGHKSGSFNDTFAVPYFNNPSTGELERTANPALATTVLYENAAGVSGAGAQTIDPESVTNYELGSKNEFDLFDTGIGMRLNGSLFYQDYRKQIFCNVVNVEGIINPDSDANAQSLGVNFCFNTKRNEIFGSQMEGALFFENDMTFKWSALWLEAYFRDGPVEIFDSRFQRENDPDSAVEVDISGNRLPRTSRYSLNMALSQVLDTPWGSLDYILSASWRDEMHLTVFNGKDYAQPENPRERLDDVVEAYWTFDFGMGFNYADTNFRGEAFVNNITDEVRAAAILITPNDNTRFFTRPRTYGFRLKWQL